MNAISPPARIRHRLEPIVEGRPELLLADEEREAIAELMAEMLIEAISTDAPTESAR